MKRRPPSQRALALLLALGGLASSLGLTVHDPSCHHHGGAASPGVHHEGAHAHADTPATPHRGDGHGDDGPWLGLAHASERLQEEHPGHPGGDPQEDCRCAELCALVGAPVAPAPTGYETAPAAEPMRAVPAPASDEGVPSSAHLRLQPPPTGPPVLI